MIKTNKYIPFLKRFGVYRTRKDFRLWMIIQLIFTYLSFLPIILGFQLYVIIVMLLNVSNINIYFNFNFIYL